MAAIQAAGAPPYEFRQIDAVDDQDGGQPGGNIRLGFLFRTDRGLTFIDRPGGDSVAATTVVPTPSGPQLSFSPGRVEPQDPAWEDSRKPLAGEFRMRGRKAFVIANHFASKSGDDPLFGRFQPPVRSTEVQRHAQAQVVNDFVDEILAADPRTASYRRGTIPRAVPGDGLPCFEDALCDPPLCSMPSQVVPGASSPTPMGGTTQPPPRPSVTEAFERSGGKYADVDTFKYLTGWAPL